MPVLWWPYPVRPAILPESMRGNIHREAGRTVVLTDEGVTARAVAAHLQVPFDPMLFACAVVDPSRKFEFREDRGASTDPGA